MLHGLKATFRNGRSTVQSALFRAARVVGSEKYKRFLVLTRPRTGSNMLISLLNSHPSVVAEGELFARLDGRDLGDLADEVLSETFCRYPPYIKAVGFKFMYNHPFDMPDRNGELWRRLRTIEDLAVIHLKRRNILRSEVSGKIAREKTQKWTRRSASQAIPVEERRVNFTASDLLERFERTRRWEERFDRELQAIPHLEVSYEDITAAPEEHLARIAAFLDVSPGRFHTILRRQNPEPLGELVTNYQELKQGFAGTEWSAFFSD